MQDFEYGKYVYVASPNEQFRQTHGTIGRFEKADEASSLLWIKFEKDQEIRAVEAEYVSPVRKRGEFASYKGEKVYIEQPVLEIDGGRIYYIITYPDYQRGTTTVDFSELSDWVEPELSDWVEPELTPDDVIADLTDHLYNVSKELDRYRTMYLVDMAHWENTMRDVKDREGWCDEGTNKIIGELNGGFIGWQLDYYEQDFEIEVEIRATIATTARIMVSATSEEAAYELVIDDPESYFNPTAELADAAQYCDYEVDVA
jgi:hypothetical protein